MCNEVKQQAHAGTIYASSTLVDLDNKMAVLIPFAVNKG